MGLDVSSRAALTGAGASSGRWREFLGNVVGLLPAGTAAVVIDGYGGQYEAVAERLAVALRVTGRPCLRLDEAGAGAAAPGTVLLADGPGWRAARDWDVVIWVRGGAAGAAGLLGGQAGAHIVVDLSDPAWPVIRNVIPALAGRGHWYVSETRAFFSSRAATWDSKFGDDMPAYAAAVAQARIRPGAVAIDVGCGTGRALPALRRAVGPDGAVIAADLTPEMLRHARARGRAADAVLVLADARQLPFARASADAVFAAGLVNHMPDPESGLRELARVTRPGGQLIVFHPSGRAALAARHGRALDPGEPLAADPLRRLTAASGWDLTSYDDGERRFLAIATRRVA